MHVVHQDDHGLAGDHAREEGQAVLHVDNDVDRTEVAGAQRAQALEVYRQLRPAVHEPDPGALLDRSAAGVMGAEHRGVAAAFDNAGSHLLEVALGPAALGIAGVAPAQKGDVEPGERGVVRGHRGKTTRVIRAG